MSHFNLCDVTSQKIIIQKIFQIAEKDLKLKKNVAVEPMTAETKPRHLTLLATIPKLHTSEQISAH